ncbi:domain found in IF2B/IF5-domain-containing protein [Zopfochytrium polystomum]|nr:domain found in IF2B/IF5-domain-containing protein [Zopfochytrium polystomum]
MADIPADDPGALFEGMKKRKKKKPKALDEESAPAPVEASESAAPVVQETAQAVEPEPAAPADHVADAVAAQSAEDSTVPAPAAAAFDFGPKKKKGNKKRPDLAEFEKILKAEGGVQTGEDAVDDSAAGVETGAQSSSTADVGEGSSGVLPSQDGGSEEPWLGSTRDYTYDELLTRVFRIIRQQNPDISGEKNKYRLPPPQVLREGTKKTVFANVVELSKKMRREPDHVIQYLFSELGTTGSVDGSQRLVIRGRFPQKHIENVLKRYIVEYVTCRTCKSGDTILSKENRLFFLQCQSCGSTKSVSAIKTGFVAQTQKRSAQRAAAGV